MESFDFSFELPGDLIAQHPARPRDSARLLCPPASDYLVTDLPSLLRPGDILVANDTSVIPAQMTAWRGQARIGITLDRPWPDGTWHALARNARRLRPGDHLRFDSQLQAEILAVADGSVTLRFDGDDLAIQRAAAIALPPYIDRPAGPLPQDTDDYQTIFARNEGAVAAPTAGLHFTPNLLSALDARGIRRTTITLHVGAGTFLPMRVENPADHRMHAERGCVTTETISAINQARAGGGRVVAVGTTTLRLLETAAADGTLRPFSGDTDLFIRPGYQFRIVDLLLTNFHLPRSTLFMLVCAFAGTISMQAAYRHAIAQRYRFYSYGDACLLARA